MRSWINRVPTPVILLVTPLLALGVGILVVYLISVDEERGRWRQLAPPPGEITRLLTGDEGGVLVETADGRMYDVWCQIGDKDETCLQPVLVRPTIYPSRCDSQDFAPPGEQVVDRFLSCVGHEYIIHTQYVLRQDGTLWRWTVAVYPYWQLIRFLWIVGLSLVGGAIAGIAIVIRRRHSFATG